MMFDHLPIHNDFDDLKIVYFLDRNNLLLEYELDFVVQHQLELIDQDDLFPKIK